MPKTAKAKPNKQLAAIKKQREATQALYDAMSKDLPEVQGKDFALKRIQEIVSWLDKTIKFTK